MVSSASGVRFGPDNLVGAFGKVSGEFITAKALGFPFPHIFFTCVDGNSEVIHFRGVGGLDFFYHLWLVWALLTRPWYTRLLAIGMSVVEIVIITTLFIWFLAEPEWSIWRTNWFVNKVFVLTAFVLVLSTALFRSETLKT